MAYATADGVQGRVPKSVLREGFTETSQPTLSQVEAWLEDTSSWIDATLAWRYQTPVANDTDAALLKSPCEALVAARVWGLLGGGAGRASEQAGDLRREALQTLGYQQATGRSNLTLPNSSTAPTPEAATGQAESSFTDPDSDDGPPRLFSISMDF